MPGSTLRRSIWGLVALVLVLAIVLAAVPYVASTRIVRDRIAFEIGAWSGYRVDIGSPPTIEIWPRLRAVLADVTFSDPDAAQRAVATVERMELELSAVAALRGDAVFTSARLVRPSLVANGDDERPGLSEIMGKGRIRSTVEQARTLIRQRSATQRLDLPGDPFGRIEVVDGSLLLDNGGARETLVSAINGNIDWPAFDRAGTARIRAVWRGEPMQVEAQSGEPLLLFAGGMGPLRLSFDSAALQASFDGTARFADQPFLNGQVSVKTTAFDRLPGWAGLPNLDGVTSLAISGAVTGDISRFKLDQAQVQVNGNRANGAIELALGTDRMSMSGSLAFDTLKLDQLLDALLPAAAGQPTGTIAENPPYRTLMDLRLSAARASAGGVELADVAAAVQLQDRQAAFDLLDASAFGGTLEAGLRLERKPEGTIGEVMFSASNVDGAAFAAAAGMPSLVPAGRGSASLRVKGKGTDIASIIDSGDGKLSAHFAAGAVSHFDLATFLSLCRKGGFFRLDEASNGTLAADGVDVDATITGGVAHVHKAEVRFGDRRLWVAGLASYADRGLALNGGIGPLATAEPHGPDEATFFVGGSWGAPFISPTTALPSAN